MDQQPDGLQLNVGRLSARPPLAAPCALRIQAAVHAPRPSRLANRRRKRRQTRIAGLAG